MKHGIRLSNRLKVLAFIFAMLFVLSACAGPQIVTVTPAPEVTTTASASSIGPTSESAPGVTSVPAPSPTPTPIPPVASFEVDVRSGSAPFIAQFSDTTDGPVSSVEWDFGDGESSTESSPSHEYTKAGTHTVRLFVTGTNGSDNEIRTSYITVEPGPVVGLSIRPEHPVVPVNGSVNFEALAVDVFGNGVSVEAEWVLNSTEGTLGDTGLFTAGTKAQTLTSVLTAAAITDAVQNIATASVTIVPGPPHTVEIDPAPAELRVQASHQFSFEAFDEFGNLVTDAASTWAATDEVGSITAAGEIQTGKKAGSFTDAVRVTMVSGSSSISASVDLTIQPDFLETVVVSPPSTTIIWQHSQQYSATGKDRFGNPIDDLAVAWEATGGEIDETGRFLAGTKVGTHSVTATGFSGVSKSGTASIRIPAPEFSRTRTFGDPEARRADGVLIFNKGVAVDSAGNIFVADRLNYRVQKFSPEGEFLLKWGRQGREPGEFAGLRDIALDSTGNVYTTEENANRIQKFDSSGNFLFSWGEEGDEPGEFRRPQGITIDSNGNVYVADQNNHRVQKFDSDGRFLTLWGGEGSGPGQLRNPAGIDVGPSGDVYVADSGNRRINKYTNSGSLITFWGNSEDLDPDGVAVDEEENVFVVSLGGANVQKFSAIGELRAQWGGHGTGSGFFFWPHGIDIGPDGDVYVADTRNNRIQQFSPTGGFRRTIGNEVAGPGNSRSPIAVAVSPDGNVYISDFWDGKIIAFDSNGEYLSEFGEKGLDFSRLNNPDFLAIDSMGDIFVDGSIGRFLGQGILKFSPDGELITSWGKEGTGEGEFLGAVDIAIDRFGRVYVADADNHRVQVFTGNGGFITQWGAFGTGPGFFDRPLGIAIDAQDNVIVADSGNARIQVFNPDGELIAVWDDGQGASEHLKEPTSIAIDHLGNVYVLDSGTIKLFTSEGEFLTEWGDGELDARDIAIDSAGKIYIPEPTKGVTVIYASPALTPG